MKVPFINYPRAYQLLKPEIDQAIQGCLERGDLIYRDDLIKFEKDFAEFCGCKYGISTGSCTGAMFIALKALGIGPGDEVITVSHTYIATIDVIVACGATPVLVDITDDYTMDMYQLEKTITASTKAIIPVHLNGRMCDMKYLSHIKKLRPEIAIIQDAAQAVGAKYMGEPCGFWSDISCFSFYPAKILGSYGEGGMVVADNEALATLMYMLRDHGEWPGYPNSKNTKGIIFGWGYNTILDNIQAAVLNVKMKYLEGYIERRREIAGMYTNSILWDLYPDIILSERYHLRDGKHNDVFQNYVIRVSGATDYGQHPSKRDELAKHLADNGIETMVKDRIPNHKQKGLGLDNFHLPMTEQISNEVLSLPMYPELTDEEVEYVIDKVREFFGNQKSHQCEPYHTGPGEIVCRICGEPCSAKRGR